MTKVSYRGTQHEKRKSEIDKDTFNDSQFQHLLNSTPSEIDTWLNEHVNADASVKSVLKYLFRYVQYIQTNNTQF